MKLNLSLARLQPQLVTFIHLSNLLDKRVQQIVWVFAGCCNMKAYSAQLSWAGTELRKNNLDKENISNWKTENYKKVTFPLQWWPLPPTKSEDLTSLLAGPLWYLARWVPTGGPFPLVCSVRPLRLDKLVLSLVWPTLGRWRGILFPRIVLFLWLFLE